LDNTRPVTAAIPFHIPLLKRKNGMRQLLHSMRLMLEAIIMDYNITKATTKNFLKE